MENETIINYVKSNKELTYNGIEWNFKNRNYKSQRAHLLNAIEEIQKCVWWLVEFYLANKTMSNMKSSYGTKLYVEKYFGEYVSNGSFVTAVELLRLNYRSYEGDPNIYIPFNNNRLKEYREKFFNLYG